MVIPNHNVGEKMKHTGSTIYKPHGIWHSEVGTNFSPILFENINSSMLSVYVPSICNRTER